MFDAIFEAWGSFAKQRASRGKKAGGLRDLENLYMGIRETYYMFSLEKRRLGRKFYL